MPEGSFYIAQGLFLKGIALIYLIAFCSLAVQLLGLYGSQGLAPIRETMQWVRTTQQFWHVPTLFWFQDTDRFLKGAACTGIVASFIALFGFAMSPLLALLWFLYLSFHLAGYPFLNFQWDALLLECGFIAIFVALVVPLHPLLLIVLWLLLFRFMFSSGFTKLAYGSSEWRDLSAMDYHYETQPLPTRLAYYAHRQPRLLSQASVIAIFMIELLIPLFIFGSEPYRIAAFWILAGLQILILATGSYAFFNLLTIVLCLPLLSDAYLAPFAGLASFSPLFDSAGGFLTFAGIFFIGLNLLEFSTLFLSVPSIHKALRPFKALSLVNGYGLFVHMTTIRNEIIIEGSHDQQEWKPYVFKWKPQDLLRAPKLAAPHQPRLDWHMWFAALTQFNESDWFARLMIRLLEGSPDVLKLFAHNPFPDQPPKYIRSQIYRYRFTTPREKIERGAWWKREYLGAYSPIYSRIK